MLPADATQSRLLPVRSTKGMPPAVVGALAVAVSVLLWFYLGEKRYTADRSFSAFEWIWSAWNRENDFEHGPLFPLVIIGMIVYRFKDLRRLAGDGCAWGLLVILIGAVFHAAGYRTLQPRVTMGALPFLLWGGVLYLWGWQVARLVLFPLFFFWVAIPLPSFQQATVGLQILSANSAHQLGSLLGVDSLIEGTAISSVRRDWGPLEIAKGCSGIRSLMALLMIAGAWAYVARMALWKRAFLFAAAVPIAVLGNILRLTSIIVLAERGNAKWAAGTWHDWSGLLLFYPISLCMLLCVHSLLEGGIPWRKEKRRTLRRVVVDGSAEPSKPFLPE